ncbi:MAG: hypothetical protein ACOYL6_06260 [Bacteriovoracaceae bacterium]
MFILVLGISLFSDAYAGMILPNLEKSKSIENESPIAVGWSKRKAASIAGAYGTSDVEANGTKTSEDKNYGLDANVFLHTENNFSIEAGLGYSKTKTTYQPSARSDSNTGNTYSGALAVAPTDKISAGIKFDYKRDTDISSGVRVVDDMQTITPGVGYKIMPNLGLGVGMSRRELESTTKANPDLVFPTLNYNEFFAGAAYGVDQVAGENGFGAELTVKYHGKKRVTGTPGSLSVGKNTKVSGELHYLNDLADVYFNSEYAFGKDYTENSKDNFFANVLRFEYYIVSTFYLAPRLGYITSKTTEATSSTSTKLESALYGLGAGYRTKEFDTELGVIKGDSEYKYGTSSTNFNAFNSSLRFTYYF